MTLPRLPLRRQYLRIAVRSLVEGRASWVVRQGMKTAGVPLSARLGWPLSGPLIVNFLVTYRCNSSCFMCDWPRPWFHRGRGTEEMDGARIRRLIDEIASLGVAGLNLTGGEPLLRPDCIDLVAWGKAAGLFVNVNSNGSTLAKPGIAEALVRSGVDAINLSLDGATSDTNDRLRGRRGGFEEVGAATRAILAARRDRRPTLTYMFAVGPDNHRELPAFVQMARDRGIDSVSFLPLLPIFRDRTPLAPAVIDDMAASIEGLRRLKRNGLTGFIDNSDDYLSLFARSWRGEPSPLTCYVPYSHLAIDAYGNVYPCGMWIQEDRRAGNVRDGGLPELWRSGGYREIRRQLAGCRACYWNCHAEANLLYQGVGG